MLGITSTERGWQCVFSIRIELVSIEMCLVKMFTILRRDESISISLAQLAEQNVDVVVWFLIHFNNNYQYKNVRISNTCALSESFLGTLIAQKTLYVSVQMLCHFGKTAFRFGSCPTSLLDQYLADPFAKLGMNLTKPSAGGSF